MFKEARITISLT